MKLSSILLLAAGTTAQDVSATNFRVIKTRNSRLTFQWNIEGDASLVKDWDVVLIDDSGRLDGVENKNNPHKPIREIRSLRPATKYFIYIKAVGDGFEGPEQTFTAYTSPRGVANAWVSDRTQDGCTLAWEPSDGADMYRLVDLDTNEESWAFSSMHYAPMYPGETKNFEIFPVACGVDCMDPPNEAYGRPFAVRATSVPPAPLNVKMVDLSVSDFDYADAVISWSNPAVGEWDFIKGEYSPNDPPAKTQTPTYASAKFLSDLKIYGLFQDTVYTFTVRFVSDDVEGPAESYTYAINDYSVDSKNGAKPAGQTCRVPTYLRPENLRVRRDIFNPHMEVTWEHPKSKKPENGYRLVFAPFADILDHKVWTETVSGDTDKFIVDGHTYDPYEEYTVSVIALHDEYTGEDLKNPDFIASHFTGTHTKREHPRELYVAPDACCGSVRHNSKERSCCGGNLIEDNELCCKDSPYNASELKCCGDGKLVRNSDDC